jgi:hypothetical protein
MPYYLSPIGNDQQCDANGNPFVGGKIFTYLAGTSTAAATYTDSTSGTSQANPIILNSLGLPASPIWMLGGQPLKFIIQDSTGVLIRTIDNVSGVNDVSSLLTFSEWVASGFTPTFISGTSFSVVGDKTSILQVNRRIQTTNSGGTVYSSILTSVFSAGITTVTVSNDSGSLDSGLSVVQYALLSATNPSVSTAVTQASTDNSTKVATTAYVKSVSPPQIQPISASVAANALTISASLLSLDFRSTTLGSGTVTTVSGTPANLVVPSTATLGTTNATQSRLVVLALNNAGAIELAVVNISGGNDLTETGLISTTAISAAATSASVVYSTTARTNVAYRVIGYVESTQATAGTWATAPSTIQGYGGQALAAMSSIGYGQTWQAVTRSPGTTYFNTTGKPIVLATTWTVNATGGQVIYTINGFAASIGFVVNPTGGFFTGGANAIIPVGASYVFSGPGTYVSACELR